VSGYCENDNKLASSIKGREFLGQLSAYWVLKFSSGQLQQGLIRQYVNTEGIKQVASPV
jgi:hypothetical protein